MGHCEGDCDGSVVNNEVAVGNYTRSIGTIYERF